MPGGTRVEIGGQLAQRAAANSFLVAAESALMDVNTPGCLRV
ncbi:MAG TPA: hypothetical protein VK639_06915 [Terriglobales bacterium]|nr:hypothetical protein [Terriglobales bacterium]